MSENKKLKIKSDENKAPQKKLVLKKSAEPKGLKIKATQLPDLQETPEPQAVNKTKAPSIKLHICRFLKC